MEKQIVIIQIRTNENWQFVSASLLTIEQIIELRLLINEYLNKNSHKPL